MPDPSTATSRTEGRLWELETKDKTVTAPLIVHNDQATEKSALKPIV